MQGKPKLVVEASYFEITQQGRLARRLTGAGEKVLSQ
jgi:hypothetical protein